MSGELNLREQARFRSLDQLDVADLVQRERLARDNGLWDEMASYYHPDSVVDVSWFKGSGAEFVAQSRKLSRPEAITLHLLSPSIVTVRGDRAIVETPCTMRNFLQIDGVDACYEGVVRLHARALRQGERWLLAGGRIIYVRDLMLACSPDRAPKLDAAILAGFRPSYKYLAYCIALRGGVPRHDLPGIDLPETVSALRESELRWLERPQIGVSG